MGAVPQSQSQSSEIVFSCPDWEDRLKAGLMPLDVEGFLDQLNAKRIDKAEQIFGRLRVPDLPNQPTMFDTAGEWLFDVVRLAAGGLGADGIQRIKTLSLVVPKKSGKSSGAAALAITLLLLSPRPNADFAIFGPTQAISDISFRQCCGIIQADPTLAQLFRIRDHLKRIEHIPSGSRLSIKTLDMATSTGGKYAMVLLDEAHLLNSDKHARVVTQLRGAGAAIAESQLIQISTMADVPAAGYWKSELAKMRGVRDGKIDVSGYVPLIWEPPKEYQSNLADCCTPEVLAMVNPNLGRSVSMDWLKSSLKEALSEGDEATRRWLSQHANVEVALFNLADDAWGGAELWPSAATEGITLEYVLQNCSPVSFGFDGGGADDITAIAAAGKDNSGNLVLWVHCFVWPIALERRQSIAGMLKDFVNDGDLTICEPGADVDAICKIMQQARQADWDVMIGCDPAGIAAELRDALIAHDFDENNIIAIKQGFALRSAYLNLERRLTQGTIKHGSQAIFDWAVSNSRQDPNSGLVTKKASGIGKIDPLVAAATAVMVLQEAKEPADVSFWVI